MHAHVLAHALVSPYSSLTSPCGALLVFYVYAHISPNCPIVCVCVLLSRARICLLLSPRNKCDLFLTHILFLAFLTGLPQALSEGDGAPREEGLHAGRATWNLQALAVKCFEYLRMLATFLPRLRILESLTKPALELVLTFLRFSVPCGLRSRVLTDRDPLIVLLGTAPVQRFFSHTSCGTMHLNFVSVIWVVLSCACTQ